MPGGHQRPMTKDAGGTEELEAALQTIISRDRLVLLKILMGYVGDWHAAEDLAQEVFVRIFTRLREGHRADSMPRAWVIRVATNLAHDRARSAWHRRVETRDVLDTDDHESLPDAAHEALRHEHDAVIWNAIQSLPEAQRQVVTLYYFYDRDLKTIGQTLGVREGAVKARLFRARSRLAQALAPLIGDDFNE